MKWKVISFDLQGTLTDTAFSDEFWLELLPRLFAEHHGISIDEGKKQLEALFKTYGPHDLRYYSVEYWRKELSCSQSFFELAAQLQHRPKVYSDMMDFVGSLQGRVRLVITSSTTRDFIVAEFEKQLSKFERIFSSIDDFEMAGKPLLFYEKITATLGVKPEEILHIGDNREMDVTNAQNAGLAAFYFDKTVSHEKLLTELREQLG